MPPRRTVKSMIMRTRSPVILDLLLPGLFDRLAEWNASYAETPDAPILSGRLGKAGRNRQPGRGFERTLCALLDPGADSDAEPPLGCWLSGLDGAVVCCAEPVHLKPGISDLVLVDSAQLRLEDDEAALLEKQVDEYLRPVGGRFVYRDGMGFLGFEQAPPLRSWSSSEVAGRGIQARLPGGEDSAWWHRLLNELQMLMYDSALNRLREERGKAPVSGLWLWGGGERRPRPEGRYDAAIADGGLAERLLRQCGVPVVDGIEAALTQAAPGGGRILWVWRGLQAAAQYDDYAAWREQLRRLDERLGQVLRSDLRCHDWRINLISDGWRFEIRPRQAWRFWRRSRSLTDLAAEGAARD